MDRVQEWYNQRPLVSRSYPGAGDRIAKSLSFIRSAGPKTVLDIGCGDGATALLIADACGASVVGVDVSETSVAIAREAGVVASVCHVGSEPLPFADASMDVVYMAEVIEHLVDPDRALTDIARVLKNDGHLVLSTPNLACLLNRAILLFGLQPFFTEVSSQVVIGRKYRAFSEGEGAVGHLRIATLKSLRILLEMYGFTVDRVVGATFLQNRVFRAVEAVACLRPSLASIVVVDASKRH